MVGHAAAKAGVIAMTPQLALGAHAMGSVRWQSSGRRGLIYFLASFTGLRKGEILLLWVGGDAEACGAGPLGGRHALREFVDYAQQRGSLFARQVAVIRRDFVSRNVVRGDDQIASGDLHLISCAFHSHPLGCNAGRRGPQSGELLDQSHEVGIGG
jgi:hypothetical protein